MFVMREQINLLDYMTINKEVTSELFCAAMSLVHQNIPCAKSVNTLKKNFTKRQQRERINIDIISNHSSRSASPLASPKYMSSLKNKIGEKSRIITHDAYISGDLSNYTHSHLGSTKSNKKHSILKAQSFKSNSVTNTLEKI
jgi:hypothetical protein